MRLKTADSSKESPVMDVDKLQAVLQDEINDVQSRIGPMTGRLDQYTQSLQLALDYLPKFIEWMKDKGPCPPGVAT